MNTEDKLVIYQAADGAIELPVDAKLETIWASQRQIAEIFGVTPQNITIHLAGIYKEGEMDEELTCKESLQVQKEGSREVKRTVKLYNLDVIIAVGYRISSIRGTAFRKWATKTLRDYISDGFVIDKKRIEYNNAQFLRALSDLKLLSENVGQVGSSEATDIFATERTKSGLHALVGNVFQSFARTDRPYIIT